MSEDRAMADPLHDEIERLQKQLAFANHQLESALRVVETMDANHAVQAKLLADTGRERDELKKQLVSARAALDAECEQKYKLVAENLDLKGKIAALTDESSK